MFELISKLIVIYYITYRNLHNIDIEQMLQYVYTVLYKSYQETFPNFKTIYSIELLEFPHEHIYLLDNNDIDYDSMKITLLNYIYQHYHTISNHDIIIAINPIPIDGFDIRHGEILQLLDPIYL